MCSLKYTSKEKKTKSILSRNDRLNHSQDVITSADMLRTLIRKNSVRVVDVRKEDEYKKEHIKTAVSIPLAKVLDNDSPERIVQLLEQNGISDKIPVVVYDDTFGALAARVAWTFQYVGHSNTSLLETTFAKWKSYGFETEKKVNVFPHAEHSLRVNNEIFANYNEVEKAKGEQNKILIDSRERLNFLSEHIPGATNLPYTMLGTADSILREPQEIKRFMENRGISTNDEVITYCGSVGTLSGLAYYALRMGGVKKIRLYSRSFKEWKKLGKPIEEFKDANFWDLSAE
ncbi:MAG TPA: rhodanese-like domain-containing protein [Nitrososphaeraceae archaeon]|jgi:thiosulfate/3-mercaptopyruvate sulfurtransferase|nr:rhodanese-like domain-containing protein [Nitrososphaeraceae archaeon]